MIPPILSKLEALGHKTFTYTLVNQEELEG